MSDQYTGRTINIIQITDTHLFKDKSGRLLGMDTSDSLDRVLDLIQKEQRQIDLMMVTGDVAQDGTPQAYQQLFDKLAPMKLPFVWLPGNHDHQPSMRKAVEDTSFLFSENQALGFKDPRQRVLTLGDWTLVLLDSTIPGKVPGHLAEDELNFLKQTIQAYPDQHLLVSFHHQPIHLNCQWLDPLGIQNSDELFSVVKDSKNIKALLWGHIHQTIHDTFEHIQLMATPSTCVQFLPKSDGFSIDVEPPGYRWLQLEVDGQIQSKVSRVAPFDFNIDYSIKGY